MQSHRFHPSIATAAGFAVLVIVILSAALCMEIEKAKQAETEHRQEILNLNSKIDMLITENSTIKRENLDILEELEYWKSQAEEFRPYYDIPLEPELQAYTYDAFQNRGIQCDRLPFAIMLQESGGEWLEIIDTNGFKSVGYGMINETVWPELEAAGIDPTHPKGNIDAMAYIISERLERYDLEQALVSYNTGEQRMIDNDWTSTPYSQAVMERAYPEGYQPGGPGAA